MRLARHTVYVRRLISQRATHKAYESRTVLESHVGNPPISAIISHATSRKFPNPAISSSAVSTTNPEETALYYALHRFDFDRQGEAETPQMSFKKSC